MCGIGEKSRTIAKVKYFRKCIHWSLQRIIRGYADYDKWNIFNYLQNLIPDMLQDLRDNRCGSPGYLGENYTNSDGMLVNDTCHDEWDKILDRMIFLWRESNEDTCAKVNPYKEEYHKAFDEFISKYGFFGEELQTEAELEQMREGKGIALHSMNELPEYKEIYEKYHKEEKRLEEYRIKSKDEALDMLKVYFYDLWD